MGYRLNGLETKMIVKNRKGEELDITELISSVIIQGDYKQGARRLDCSYILSYSCISAFGIPLSLLEAI